MKLGLISKIRLGIGLGCMTWYLVWCKGVAAFITTLFVSEKSVFYVKIRHIYIFCLCWSVWELMCICIRVCIALTAALCIKPCARRYATTLDDPFEKMGHQVLSVFLSLHTKFKVINVRGGRNQAYSPLFLEHSCVVPLATGFGERVTTLWL